MEDPGRTLAPYLLDGETLLWTGRPDPAKHLGAQDVFLVPFSLLWGGGAITGVTRAVLNGAPLQFAAVGLLFVVLGLHLIVGRFFVKARRKRATAYGLTEGRALVAVGPRSLAESPLQRVPVDQRRSRDGRHLTVAFGGAARGWAAGPGWANTGMDAFDRGPAPVAFYDVADVAGLEGALRRTKR